MQIQVRRVQVVVGALLLGGSLSSLGDGATLVAGLVGGTGLGTVLAAFAPDDEQVS